MVSAGAGSAAASFGLAVRLVLVGAFPAPALVDDLRAAGFLAVAAVPGSAAETVVPLLSVLLEVALVADFLVGAFFAGVFRVVEAAFLVLAADSDALGLFSLRGFDFGFACAEESSVPGGDSDAAAVPAIGSAAGTWDFVRDLRVALGFLSPAVLGMAVLAVRPQSARLKIRRTRIIVRESTIWQWPLLADSGGTGTLSTRTHLDSRV